MSLQGLMQKLADNRVEVWLEDGKLRYRAPKQSMTEALMAELKANKQALIDYLQAQQQQPFALTYGQRALWFLHQTAPNSAAYNVAFSARILSAVDTDKMNRALLYLAGRHPALKLRFREQAGEPEQFISPDAAVDFQVIDGTAWSEETLQQQVNRSYETPFNLNNQQPLFRVRLFKRSPQQTVLLLVFHHIIGDGWSLWLLLDELAQVYSALVTGRQPELPALSSSYRQFAEQQVARVDSGELEQDWHYWRDKFAQTPPLLSLPSKRPFPAQRSYQGASYPLRIDSRTLAALKLLAAELGVTLYVLLLSAYQLLLHRCGGQQQLCVGTPLAGRDDDRYAGVVGYFVNPLPLLSELNAEQTVADFIKACRQEVLSAMAHQAFPLALVLERLALSRDASRLPLFQSAFVFQQLQKAQQLLDTNSSGHAADKTVDWGGLSLAPYTLFQQEGQFDLSLELMEAGGDLIGSIKFNTDILDVDDAQRLADYYLNILNHLPGYKDSKAALVPLLNEAYQQQLLQDWNATAYSYPDTLIPELLSRQAQQTPDAIALVYQQTELTYAELEQRSNQLARYLTQQGVGIESLVAVCMERSLEMVISLHAIVKAGAAYVPLDPDYPQERLDYMIANAGAQLCLTQQALTGKLGDYPGRLLCIEDLQTELAQQPSTAPTLKLQPDNIAYLIYTSGSTGQPKGVANNHQALANRINWMQRRYGLNRQDTVLQKTPYSFDVSVWEFFWPLITGAKLVIAKPNGHKDSHYLARLIQEQQINTLHFVPSMLQAFIEEPQAAHCSSLKRIICSGEALPLSLQQQVHSKLDARLYNLYGPTEAAIDVSEWPCRADDTAGSIVAIGKPIDNIRLYILDSQLQPVPVGVSGELYIAGIGLARGYYRKAQLTAERFIPNPFGQGERMYRTGDICRYRADGVIEYQGREDGQVKLRGFRIELGEIEAVLKKHQAVQNCVLTADQFRGEKALLAYMTLHEGVENTAALIKQIREFMQGFLPDYMLPAGFMVLDALPLSGNGKVDRKALPAMELVSSDEHRTAPENGVQIRIADIWQQLLKRQDFGIHTNFFHVGGHSLLALRLIAKLTEAFQAKLSIEDVFNHSTIEGLSRLLTVEDHAYQAWPAIEVRHQDQAPLAFSQERLWFVNTLENAAGVYHIPLAFHLLGQLNKPALTGAIKDLINRHHALRTKIVGTGHSLEQQVLAGIDHPLGYYSEDQVNAQGLEQIVRQEANATLDLATGQVFKAALLDVDNQHSLLLLVMHHIIFDGWSVNVVLHDLSALYQQRLQNSQSRLPELPVQYTDYCYWQRQLSDEGWFKPARDYWLEALQDAPTTLALNYDHSRPMLPTFRGAMLFNQIPAQTRASLQAYAQQQGATDFMLLLSAFSVLLYRYSGQQDFMIGTPVANRDKLELHDLVGLFVNTLLMRIKIDSNQRFEQLLDAVKTTALAAYEHQYYPFEGLVEALQPERNLAVTPLFQVMFVYQGQEQQAFSLAGLDVQPMVLPSTTAKCDLTLYVTEQGDHWSLAMEYSTDLFEQASIEQLLSSMATALDEVAKNPGLPLARIPLLTTAQQTKVLKDWNATAYSYPDTLIPELLSRQAQQTPDAIALVYEQTQLTYAELEQRSNQLAHYLTQQGVGIESLVAVCMERSLEMVISLHAIVKAGAAYVPLDPDYPQERLDYMIANAGTQLCLTQQALTGKLGDYPGRLLCVEDLQSELERQPSTVLTLKLQPDNIAYLIYTSGSTGQPKGVANNHQALANRINWMQRAYGLNQHDTVLQKTPYSFDVSVWEFFWPLITGAKLVIAKPNGHKDSHYLAQLIQTQQINTVHFVPSMLQAFIDEPEAAYCASLERIICSGEALPLSLQQQVHSKLDAQLYNLYGPTEAAIDVSEWPCQADDSAGSIVAIGKPIDNIQLYILDSQLQPVPVGVSGELYIAGIGLARGYYRKAQLTAERFIPNPFGHGERMYRTGDICRYRPDGVIEYQGREDGQVKLRGFRIELGEIESVLKQHPDIQDAAVKVWEQGQSKRLVAYLVSKAEQNFDEAVKQQLQQLPDYMRPSQYVRLEKLPLTASGKLDRKALKETEIKVQQQYTPARNALEQTLVDIWQEVLKQERIGIDDNYFELGGDSILSIQIVARARQAGLDLRVEDLFLGQTIAELAGLVKHAEQQAIKVNTDNNRLPLSPTQEGMLFHALYEGDKGVYCQQIALEFSGDVQADLFKQAWWAVFKQHDALRRVFIWQDSDKPYQALLETGFCSWQELDWCSLPVTDRQQKQAELQAEQAAQGFDVSRGPLSHLTLIKLAEQRYYLLWSYHHLLMDGWSLPLVLTEVAQQYQALPAGQVYRPKPARPFADYIHWLAGQDRRPAIEYWQQQLSKIQAATALLCVERKTGTGYADQVMIWDDRLSQDIKVFVKQQRTTLAVLLQAAWALILNRYSSEQDVVFGMTVSGRPPELPGIESVVGLFINTIPVTAHIDDQQVSDWLQLLTAEQFKRDAHAYLPLNKIIECSGLSAGQSLFQSLLVLENYPLEAGLLNADNSALKITDVRFKEQTNYPLTLVIVPGEQLHIKAMYQAEVFAADTISRVLAHFKLALNFLLASGSKSLADFQLVQDQERELYISHWNDTAYSYPDTLIPELLSRQARQTPAAIALVYQQTELTYAELEQRSNQLAHYLTQQGVGIESLVAVCMERCLDMVVSLHAIVKAGAAYVPLDPDYPQERLDYMIANAGAELCLTQQALTGKLGDYPGRLLCIETLQTELAQQPSTAPTLKLQPDNIAYLIYTSGSTGQPKGVANHHRALANRINWMQRAYSLNRHDTVLQKTPYSFDVSVWEFFWPLLTGAKLVIAKPNGHKDSHYLAQLIQAQQIDTLHFVPSMLQAFIDEPEAAHCASLERIICSGEALPLSLQQQVHSKLDAQLYNLYGPTEAAIDVSEWPCQKGDTAGSIVAIGKPIDNIRLYILDSQLQPVPVGVPGELYIAGIGLARGYYRKAGLTAERFIPNPFGQGERMYRTGDICRYRADGVIEYQGREDGQVKLRGFRIELGEIESVLKQHPAIQDAAVKVWEQGQSKRLVAYLVSKTENLDETIKQHVQQLPDYMRPSQYVRLEKLPLTASGKLDRKVLTEPEIKVQQQYTPARNALEQTLVGIWQDVLKQDRIGIDDNYFELGGDSILSIQIVARARQAGISLDLTQIFVAQTIAVLAQSANVAEQFAAEQGRVTGTVPCTPIQHYFFSTVHRDAQHFNQSVLLEVSPDMNPASLRQALASLLEHHDVLRMQVKRLHPAELFIPADYDVDSVLQLKTFTQAADLTGQAGRVQASFELTGSPLLRVVLFTPADKNGRGRLLLVLHHLLVDGVSWRILLEDLHRAYRSAVKQQQIRLPKKTTAFTGWATRLQQWSKTLPDQDYWQRYCRHHFAQLPLDHSADQTVTLADTTVRQLHLDSDITRALMQAPRALQASVEEVLLAALLESLWQWIGKKTLSIELEGHGRENLFADLDVSRTVGWFTTLFPLAVEARHDNALAAVKSALRELPNRGLSYGVLRYLTDQKGLQQQLQAAEQRSTGIRFNYLGRFENAEQDSVFIGQAQEPRGEERSGKQAFGLLMDVNSAVHQDCLQLDLRYSPLQFDSQTIEQLLAGFKRHLAQLLQPVTAGQASHFALAKLSEPRLNSIAGRGAVQDIYPLSPLQHGLLFHSVYAQESSSYLQQVSWHFNGELNVELWRESWQQLIQRHPILRTGFDWLGAEQPLQVVFEQVPFAWQDIDYNDNNQTEQQQLVDSFLQRDKLLPFDIKATPLLRFALLRLSATHSVFVWSYHHILLDGWSLPKLIEDVFSLYAAKVTGQQAQLPERKPFHDYIAWLLDQDSSAMEAYWRTQLNGFSAVNKLAIDLGGDSHIQQAEFNQALAVLDQDFTAAINGFAQQQRVTVNIVLQAAWVVLLSRYCSSRDVLFGLTVSGRPAGLDQVGDMLGLFINTVPVRAQLPADQTLEQLLQQLMSESLEREPFSYVQLAELQRWSQVQAGQGLFDSLFIFENYPIDETLDKQSAVLQLNDFQVYEQTDLPLTLLITPGKQLALKISYQQQRFEAQAVQRLLEHFQGIIKQMISAPQSLLTGIGLLDTSERQQLLSANEKAVDQQCLPGLCLHQLISQQAQQSANKVAVQFGDRQLTYAQLEQQSDLMAQQLLALGIMAESIVAICMPRCIEMPVALLAVLKTGAAYLPLDLNLPAKRLQYMVEDSGAELVLVKGQTDLDFPVKAQDVSQLLANQNIETQRLQAKVSPDNLAYVIYTSGSTGKPKAVQVSHKNIVNFMLTMADKPGINADDRLLAVTTLAFDIAALELYLPLTVGATVVLADSMQSVDGHTLQALLQQHDITVMQATPASWRLLLACGWQGNARFKVLCGGEALPINLAEQLQRCAGQVWNVYGPTETTVWSSRCLLNGADKVKLGEPLANTRLYIVDENLNLLPAGFPGELMIAGEGVARGYKNRADLTAERFIPDPFSGSGERMYRTGDQVVRHQDGSIEYLGRLDFQAKIRGYRIELGEIEARLEDRPDIDQAVAVVDQSREDNQQLLAYYRGQPLTASELRDYLSEYLPAYMLPTEFIHVQMFALTHSGKVDRKALPKPQRSGALSPSSSQPQTQTQKQLLDIWRQVLQREDFGTEDNFFDLGGHSLLLMQVWNLLQQQNKTVQTVDLFRYPSIAKLAAYLDSAGSDLPDDSVARAERKALRQRTGRLKK